MCYLIVKGLGFGKTAGIVYIVGIRKAHRAKREAI